MTSTITLLQPYRMSSLRYDVADPIYRNWALAASTTELRYQSGNRVTVFTGTFDAAGATGTINAITIERAGLTMVEVDGLTVDLAEFLFIADLPYDAGYDEELIIPLLFPETNPHNVISGSSGDDNIQATPSADFIDAGDGNDFIRFSYGWLAQDGRARGGNGDDWFEGSNGNDTMDGGAGNDTYNGWRGNDTYHIDDAGDRILFYDVIDFIPAEDQGVDRVLATVSVDLQVFIDINNERYVDDGFLTRSGIEYITLKGTADIDAAGDAGDNIITGNPGKNVLQGRGGNDILDGKSGGDLMIGGTGDDQYFVDNGNDRVIELAGEGNDTVTSKVNFSLAGQYIETLILAGNASVGTGNSQANSIYGNEGSDTLYGLGGNDRLDGGVGADTMYGGTGDDSYWIDDAGDQFIELANEGTDIVYAAKNVSLMNTHVENAQLLGVAPWSGNGGWAIGNGLANTLTGSAYNDVLNGKLGSDTLFGGAGADIFAFDTALGSTNVDTIGDFVSGEDRIRLNDSVFVGLAAVGNAQFRLGTAAVDSDDRIIYDSGTGNILFDVDGNGGQAAQLFAVLVGGVALIASDFFMA